jgi:hypothetical protein
MGKVKCQMIKQVWCVKKDWNVKKQKSDLTLEDKNPDSHKSSSIVDQTCLKQDLAGQNPHSIIGKVLKRRRM